MNKFLRMTLDLRRLIERGFLNEQIFENDAEIAPRLIERGFLNG